MYTLLALVSLFGCFFIAYNVDNWFYQRKIKKAKERLSKPRESTSETEVLCLKATIALQAYIIKQQRERIDSLLKENRAMSISVINLTKKDVV